MFCVRLSSLFANVIFIVLIELFDKIIAFSNTGYNITYFSIHFISSVYLHSVIAFYLLFWKFSLICERAIFWYKTIRKKIKWFLLLPDFSCFALKTWFSECNKVLFLIHCYNKRCFCNVLINGYLHKTPLSYLFLLYYN